MFLFYDLKKFLIVLTIVPRRFESLKLLFGNQLILLVFLLLFCIVNRELSSYSFFCLLERSWHSKLPFKGGPRYYTQVFRTATCRKTQDQTLCRDWIQVIFFIHSILFCIAINDDFSLKMQRISRSWWQRNQGCAWFAWSYWCKSSNTGFSYMITSFTCMLPVMFRIHETKCSITK